MDSLKAELNIALQCDREAEDEVKKLKVRGNTSESKFATAHATITINIQTDPLDPQFPVSFPSWIFNAFVYVRTDCCAF